MKVKYDRRRYRRIGFVPLFMLFLLCSLVGCYGQTDSTETETITVKEYLVDDSVGEHVEEGEEQKEELIEVSEEEVPVQILEAVTESSQEDDGDVRFISLDSLKTSVSNDIKDDEKSLGLSGKSPYYYYKKLNEREKAIYRSILASYQNQAETFEIAATKEEFAEYNRMVKNDHPELFWLDSSYTYWDYGSYVKVKPSYNRDQASVKADQKKMDQAVAKALKDAPVKGKAYEKTKYVFQYLINELDYDINASDNQNIYSALVNHVTVCAGYAKATQYLLQKMGVDCIYVCGQTKRGYHAWNIVKCGDHYYQVDTTWGDPNYSSKDSDIPAVLQYDYTYLCIDDDTMYQERKVDASPEVPECDSKDKAFYPLNKRYFSKYGDEVKNSIRKNLKNGKSYWHGQFATKEAYNDMIKAVKKGMYSQLIYDVNGGNKTIWYWTFDESRVVKLYY